MVVATVPLHVEFGPNDHRQHASPFTLRGFSLDGWQSKKVMSLFFFHNAIFQPSKISFILIGANKIRCLWVPYEIQSKMENVKTHVKSFNFGRIPNATLIHLTNNSKSPQQWRILTCLNMLLKLILFQKFHWRGLINVAVIAAAVPHYSRGTIYESCEAI